MKSFNRPERARQNGGFTIVEIMVVLTILAILVSMSAPSFALAIEQSKADITMANLRSIWVAERAYWLDNRVFTSDLSVLQGLDLVDVSLVTQTTPYTYSITTADGTNLLVVATRAGSPTWSGAFSIDQTGAVTGSIQAAGQTAITPSYQ